ncbi:MAG: flagellin lysine-N-methylase [Oscillospiraceae bacterium]|nr:flagellin lysine-N-methylase [Oscillospiraceae bacterium]
MYYRQPRYFGDFKCIGGTCTNSCCVGWRIDWTAEEIDKVRNDPNCSEELKALCDRSFIKIEGKEKYFVMTDVGGRCPFLTEDNFCRIQRELGEEYLSFTCSIYPRHYVLANDVLYRYCNMSCPEVMRRLLNDPKSMDLVNVAIKKAGTIKSVIQNTPKSLANNPALKFREELMEFFYEIISDKKHDVETSIILGALAAQKLSQIAEKDADGIPAAILAIRPQLHNGAQLKQIEAIKPNYNIKLGMASEMLKKLFEINITSSFKDKTGALNIDLYKDGERRLAESFVGREFYLRNIALNLMLEFVVPFNFEGRTIFENYSIFAAAFAMFKLNVIATAELTERASMYTGIEVTSSNLSVQARVKVNTEKYINKSASMISRNLCHNDKNAQLLLDELAANKMTSPAYIALLIK